VRSIAGAHGSAMARALPEQVRPCRSARSRVTSAWHARRRRGSVV